MIEQVAYHRCSGIQDGAFVRTAGERTPAILNACLFFTRTRRGAERISHILKARNHSVNRIHSDRSQPQREAACAISAMVARACW
jgi:superfamily II DNA/RNA helicase